MPSPRGIFVGQSAESLATIRAQAIERLTTGDRVSLAGAGRSSSRTFSMTPEDILREVAFAEGKLNGTRIRRTYSDSRTQ